MLLHNISNFLHVNTENLNLSSAPLWELQNLHTGYFLLREYLSWLECTAITLTQLKYRGDTARGVCGLQRNFMNCTMEFNTSTLNVIMKQGHAKAWVPKVFMAKGHTIIVGWFMGCTSQNNNMWYI